MGISFKKSLNTGPFRINLSKSGVSVSCGVKGMRAGVNSKGKSYVSGGEAGINIRKQLKNNSGCAGVIFVTIILILTRLMHYNHKNSYLERVKEFCLI